MCSVGGGGVTVCVLCVLLAECGPYTKSKSIPRPAAGKAAGVCAAPAAAMEALAGVTESVQGCGQGHSATV